MKQSNRFSEYPGNGLLCTLSTPFGTEIQFWVKNGNFFLKRVPDGKTVQCDELHIEFIVGMMTLIKTFKAKESAES